MPYTWEPLLEALHPPAAKSLVENQQRKFLKDWNAASQAFLDLDERSYLHKWLIVNTRAFYWTAPRTKRPLVPDDCTALNPFADYFNHAEKRCKVQYGPMGFKIFSDRVYEEGEEIYISYVNHSNDFLLAEYGFILSENRWDEVQLDHIILSELSTKQRDQLEGVGFLGKYVLDQYTVCHRTQVAVRLLFLPLRKWRRFINGEDGGENDQAKADQILLKLLKRYSEQAQEAADHVLLLTIGHVNQREVLGRRRRQIGELLQAAINRIQNY